jgi:protein tyrosine kinase modulator
MLPGQKFTVADIVRMLTRRGWIAVLTFVVGAGAAVAISKSLPNQYRSETLIMLIPQRISEAYVKAQVTARIEDRLNSLEDQILSRSRLERIIRDLNLYSKLQRTLPMEDIVQRMRDDISVKVEGKESFRITYISQEAKTAQKATERLASLFIEENIRDRENIAEDTSQFLDAQLEEAKRELQAQEKKLEEYQSRYGGELPAQVTANLQAIQNAQVQLQTLAETADRARERRLLLERQIADLQDNSLAVPIAVQPGVPQGPGVGAPVAQLLQDATAQLNQLLQQKTPEHPDVKEAKRRIKDLEARLEAEKNKPPTSTESLAELSPMDRAKQLRIRELKLQMEDIDHQLADRQEQERKLRASVTEYQARLDAVPKRESDLVELTRDHTTLQASYQSLLVKREEARLAKNLERRNIGEQFKVLDPAKAPERPFSPNRMLIDIGGAGGGLFIGLLIIALIELRDSSFKNEEDVIRLLNVRVLAQVPLMVSEADSRTKRWRLTLIGGAFAVMAASSAALVFWKLRH